MAASDDRASAGHQLGQLVGNWFEEYFALPLLQQIAGRLGLYLDHRFRERSVRGEKIVWYDVDDNAVDFDFVMELGGSDDEMGMPVAFFESFWRRGKRHSKDKARDDSGKLTPMREFHPTARFLGIVAGGDFTEPARDLIHSRNIDLFYVPKAKIVEAFGSVGLTMDYPDKLAENDKRVIAAQFEDGFNVTSRRAAASRLKKLIGRAAINAYSHRVHSALAALPQEIRIIAVHESTPRVFASVDDASSFLSNPSFEFNDPTETFRYETTYSDGTEFSRELETQEQLRALHESVHKLAQHVDSLES